MIGFLKEASPYWNKPFSIAKLPKFYLKMARELSPIVVTKKMDPIIPVALTTHHTATVMS